MVNSRKVNARILELGLNQELIAEQMGIHTVTLNQKINNNRRFYADEVAILFKILKLSTRVELKEYFGLDYLIVAESCENETKEELGGA